VSLLVQQIAGFLTSNWTSLHVRDKVETVSCKPLKTIVAAMVLTLASFPSAGQNPSPSPQQLVRETVDNELKPDAGLKFMFRDRKQTPHGSSTKLMVQTTEAMAGMVVAYDDHPLNPEQRQAELARNQRFIRDPEELRKKRKQEKENEERINRIMKALPDAFIYQEDGAEPGKRGVGEPGVKLIRLRFEPNPKYDPPSRVEQVLTAMTGTMLIEPGKKRLASIDGTLSHDVAFGWGILGHLDKGGHFLVQQGDVDGNHWEVTRTDLAITGKLFFFKTIKYESSEVFSHFRQVSPNLTFAQALEMLTKETQSAEAQPVANTPPR
jgi:hypothetical protein